MKEPRTEAGQVNVDTTQLKRQAAERAVTFVESGQGEYRVAKSTGVFIATRET